MSDKNNSSFWEKRYQSKDIGWDLGRVTPVFEELSNDLPLGRLCVIGCGNGYDALMFAEKGFEVTAIDFAQEPIDFLQKNCAKRKLKINIIKKDIFQLEEKYNHHFDYVIEQTCFCAINPLDRISYTDVVQNILKKGGILIGLWFPLEKPLTEGGPPFGVKLSDVKSIFSKNWKIIREEVHPLSIKSRKDYEKLIIFKKIK